MLVTGGAGTGKTAVAPRAVRAADRSGRAAGTGRAGRRLPPGSRRRPRRRCLARLDASLPGLRVLTFHGLAHRVLKEREGEPPEVLSAADQFATVRELLAGQDPDAWPAYGGLLGVRGFADEVRQLLARAQESLWMPDDLAEAATHAGLSGWQELARFYGEYLDVLASANQVDFAGLLQRAALGHRRAADAVRPHPRRRLSGHDARGGGDPPRARGAGPRGGRRSRRARLLVPGDDARAARSVRGGLRRFGPGGAARQPPGRRAAGGGRVGRPTRLRGTRRRRARAPAPPRGGRNAVGRARGRRSPAGHARREPPAGPRRRADPARGAGARACRCAALPRPTPTSWRCDGSSPTSPPARS